MKLVNFVSKELVKMDTKMKKRPIRKDMWSGLRKNRIVLGSFMLRYPEYPQFLR